MRTVWIGWPLLLLCVGCSSHGHPHEHDHAHDHPAEAGHHGHGDGHAQGGDDATVTHSFADAELWAARFEDPERDVWQRPDEVLAALELPADGKLVDIGSATGYFPVRFAKAMPQGVVYGVDLEPTLVNYLNLRARREGLPNLVSLVCTADDPCVPEPVDVVFVCDTYHHIDGRKAYFSRLIPQLREGGRLVIVDFKPGELPVGPPPGHKLSAEQVTAELAEAGFVPAGEHDLPYQYLLVFRPR